MICRRRAARAYVLRRGGPDKSPAQNFNILCHYCKSFSTLRKSIGGGITYLRVRFDTRSLLCLTDIYSRRGPYVSARWWQKLFYVNKVKIIPDNIYDLLTPVAIAHWIQGDGTKHGNGLVICTDSFTICEVVTLINVLIIRYNLDCSVFNKGGYYRIYIRARSIPLLRTIITRGWKILFSSPSATTPSFFFN